MLEGRKSLRVKRLIPSAEALLLFHPFLSGREEFVHSTAAYKLHIVLIVSRVSSLFFIRREAVLGSDSQAPNRRVSYSPGHLTAPPALGSLPADRYRPELTQEVSKG